MADEATQTELKTIPYGSQFWNDPMNGNFAFLKNLIDAKKPASVKFYDTTSGCTMANGATDGCMVVITFGDDMQIVYVRGGGAKMPADGKWNDAMYVPTSAFVGPNSQILMNTGQSGNYTEVGVILDSKRGAVPTFAYKDKTGGKINPETSWASVFLVTK